jgi:O-antigen/teichoic acid export membrane protein
MDLRLRQNVSWMLVSRLGAQALAVLFNILLARSLGRTGFGQYASLAAILFIANALSTFGTDMLLIREIAVSGVSSRLRSALVIQLVLSAGLIAVVWAFGPLLPGLGQDGVLALRIFSLALIPLAFFTVFTTALRGVQRMDAYMLLSLALAAGQMSVFLVRRPGLTAISLVLLGVQAVGALLAGMMCSLAIPGFWTHWGLRVGSVWSLLRDTAPMAGLAVLTIVYQRLIVLMLLALAGPAPVGLYSAASRMIEPIRMLQVAALTAVYPVMAQEALLRPRADRPPTRGILRLLLAAATAAALALFLAAPVLVSLLYGREFAASAGSMRILAWSLIPFAVNTFSSLSLLAARREAAAGRALSAAVIVLLLIGLWQIPPSGPQGAAWAVLSAESVQCVFLLVSLRSDVSVRGQVRELPQSS